MTTLATLTRVECQCGALLYQRLGERAIVITKTGHRLDIGPVKGLVTILADCQRCEQRSLVTMASLTT